MKKLNKYHFGFLMTSLSAYVGSADRCSSNDAPSGSASTSTKKDPIQEKGEKMVEEVDAKLKEQESSSAKLNLKNAELKELNNSIDSKITGSADEEKRINRASLFYNLEEYDEVGLENWVKFLENAGIAKAKSAVEFVKTYENDKKELRKKAETYNSLQDKNGDKAKNLAKEYKDLKKRIDESKDEFSTNCNIILNYAKLHVREKEMAKEADKNGENYKILDEDLKSLKKELNSDDKDVQDMIKASQTFFDDSKISEDLKSSAREYIKNRGSLKEEVLEIEGKLKIIQSEINKIISDSSSALSNFCDLTKEEEKKVSKYLYSLFKDIKEDNKSDLYKELTKKITDSIKSDEFKNLSIEISKIKKASPYFVIKTNNPLFLLEMMGK